MTGLHVAFVCTFNQARSVTAATVFAEQLRRCGLGDLVRVTSAGTRVLAGAGIDSRAARVLAEHGYPAPTGHRATRLDADHLAADLVVALGREHLSVLQRLGVEDDRIRYVEVRNPCRGTDFDDAFSRIANVMPELHAEVDKQLISRRFETATAWRFWTARPGDVLRSPCARGVTWPKRSSEAVCRSHTPPGEKCTCGWYADLTREHIHIRARAFERFWRAGNMPRLRPYDPSSYLVVGKVDLADAALRRPQWWSGIGSKPRFEYRARAGTIRELVILGAAPGPKVDALARELSERYDVPVTVEAGAAGRRGDGDGDGWVLAADGTRYWGRHGAAGLLLWAPRPDGTPAVLLQHRAPWSHHGGTWGLPGGARDSHETPEDTALREAREETGVAIDQLRVRATVVTARAAGADWT